jgi:hypothetical protein
MQVKNGCKMTFPPLCRVERGQGVSINPKNPDKTLLCTIDNHHKFSFCQDLQGTTVMKFNKFRIKIF